MKTLLEDPDVIFQLVVTGAHLSPHFGLTVTEIEHDGFPVDARVDLDLGDNSALGVVKSMAQGLGGMAEAFARLDPDIIVVLGDRYEILVAAQAGLVLRIPLAHIHGGESTEAAIDEAIRHAVTKMAHLHFTAAEPYRRRVVQMGEQPARVFTVGALGIDNIRRLRLVDRHELEDALKFRFGAVNFLVTYHPVTLAGEATDDPVGALLNALDGFPEASLVITGANADPGGRCINESLRNYAVRRGRMALFAPSLGHVPYLSIMRLADVVIGNSSSGIIEAPALGRPTVNIGDRQKGRLRSHSVIDCTHDAESIRAAIARALSPSFKERAASAEHPYGCGGAAERIAEALKRCPLDNIIRKEFYELPGEPLPSA